MQFQRKVSVSLKKKKKIIKLKSGTIAKIFAPEGRLFSAVGCISDKSLKREGTLLQKEQACCHSR